MGKRYRDLVAGQKAMGLAKATFQVIKWFPNDEMVGLNSQVRRAAVSIPLDIAEGRGRFTLGEFKQFLRHARGSLLETETQLLLAADLDYLTGSDANLLPNQSSGHPRVLNGLIQSLG
jgi:four helix bundle protein